jgi:ATP-dependent Clp protease ATP-binding subunit ClpA
MFKRFSDVALQVLKAAADECKRLSGSKVGTEHILLALTTDAESLAARALASMGIHRQDVTNEIQRMFPPPVPAVITPEAKSADQSVVVPVTYSDCAIEGFGRSQDHCRYFGLKEVMPEHVLLGIIDVSGCGAVKILEELGANLSFLRRHIMFLMARQCTSTQAAPPIREALVSGLTDLIASNLESVQALSNLSVRSGNRIKGLPDRNEIVQMVFLGYMPDLLCTQVVFQRHLLQEALKLMAERTGPLDQELTATIVSNSAQHLRLQVRQMIESLWSSDYRLFDQMLNEAEYDLIGSVIEDLWWAQSEEIALHELFDEALVDHRRKHLLNLQKRRLEISQRLTKLRTRLAETIQQCFMKRSISA